MNNGNNKNSMNKLPGSVNECPVCNGSGIVPISSDDDMQRDPEKYKTELDMVEKAYGERNVHTLWGAPCPYCKGAAYERAERVRAAADIPVRNGDSRLTDFDWSIYRDDSGKPINTSKQQNAVNSFVNAFREWEQDGEGLGLYIFSSTKGSGKTFIASCMLNSLIDKYQVKSRFIRACDLIDIKRQSDGSRRFDSDPFYFLCCVRVLVIDDIGQKVSGRDWMNDLLFELINARMEKKLCTIFTSNVAIGKMDIDDRVIDRINQMTIMLNLPEYCVRANEANKKHLQFLKDRDLI